MSDTRSKCCQFMAALEGDPLTLTCQACHQPTEMIDPPGIRYEGGRAFLYTPLVITRLNLQTNAHLAEDFDRGEPIPGTRCMRQGCSEPRWKHPTKGPIVLCQEHGAEVVRGEAKAPPVPW